MSKPLMGEVRLMRFQDHKTLTTKRTKGFTKDTKKILVLFVTSFVVFVVNYSMI